MVPASSPSPARVAASSRVDQAGIDASCRAPVLLFLVFGAIWLLAATALTLISSIQLHNPGFLSDVAWLTFGRVRPAMMNALTYGWGFNAAFAMTLWLMARLSDSPLRAASLAVVAGLFWNLGVTLGTVGILAGDTTGHVGLEMPGYVAPILFVAYAMIAVVGVLAFRFGRSSWVYVSQWYLLAALFWFPWLYSVAQATVVYGDGRGVVQAIASNWYAYNVYGLWLAPVALAALYYLLPKVLGRPIHEYGSTRMAFWCWGLFASWIGVARLVGGPVPAWVQTAGVAAALLLLIPVIVIAINLLGTFRGHFGRIKGSPSMTFAMVSIMAFLVAGVLTAVGSLRVVAEVVQFTFASHALSLLEVYGVFSMAAFGTIYFLVPRLVRRAWPSAALLSAHLWSTVAGLLLAVVCQLVAGWLQGTAINNPEAFPNFVDVIARTVPFLVGQSLAVVLLAIGHVAFAVNFGLMLMKPRAASDAAPEIFRNPPALEVAR